MAPAAATRRQTVPPSRAQGRWQPEASRSARAPPHLAARQHPAACQHSAAGQQTRPLTPMVPVPAVPVTGVPVTGVPVTGVPVPALQVRPGPLAPHPCPHWRLRQPECRSPPAFRADKRRWLRRSMRRALRHCGYPAGPARGHAGRAAVRGHGPALSPGGPGGQVWQPWSALTSPAWPGAAAPGQRALPGPPGAQAPWRRPSSTASCPGPLVAR